MKNRFIIFSLLFMGCLTASFQCSDCETRDAYLAETRSWLPLKGKTQLTFFDNAGSSATFGLKVMDTTHVVVNQDCPTSSIREYINASLYLNPERTDSIYFHLSPQEWLCMRGLTNNSTNIFVCNAFEDSRASKRFINYTVGNRNYKEVFLMWSIPGNPNKIDSVFLANEVGIVGFNYGGKKYFLP